MEKLIDYILTQIVGTGNFSISQTEVDGVITFLIKANPDNIGLIIGKGGKVIKAIQELVKTRAKLENKMVYVKVEESKD